MHLTTLLGVFLRDFLYFFHTLFDGFLFCYRCVCAEVAGLDIVAVGIVDKGCVVGGAVGASEAGRAVVLAARRERRRVEALHRRLALGEEGDMTSHHGLLLDNPEACMTALFESGGFPLRHIHRHLIAQGCERLLIKLLCGLIIANGKSCVCNHAETIAPQMVTRYAWGYGISRFSHPGSGARAPRTARATCNGGA